MPEAEQESSKTTEQVALVTAGAAGIGGAIARRLLQQGLRVHICDIDTAAIETFLKEHPQSTASHADVSSTAQVEAVFADLQQQYGRLDVLVNNAGTAGPIARVEDISPEDWDRTIAVNLNGAFYVARLAIPLLKQSDGGSIINIASTAALFGVPLRSPYAAAKWALLGFTKTLAMELGTFGIRVNAICPGCVNGPRIEAVLERDAKQRGQTVAEIRDIWTRQTSLRCFVDAEDIAAMAAFLISDQGARISGQALGVDGHTESLSNPLD